MSMWQMMFTQQCHSPIEELLTAHVEDMVLVNGLTGMSGSVAALLALFTDGLTHDAVDALTRLVNVKVKC